MAEDLVTIRGLVDSDFDIPLREFDAEFDGHETEPAKGYEGTRVNLYFKELENIISVSPYNLPTVTLNLGLTNKHKSRWGYLADSIAALIDADEDIKQCKGRSMHLVFTDGEDGRPEPENYKIWSRDAKSAYEEAVAIDKLIEAEDDDEALAQLKADRKALGVVYEGGMVPTALWIVTSIDGVSAGEAEDDSPKQSAADYAETNLIGKSLTEFNKWALADPKIRKDKEVQQSIIDKSFVKGLVKLNKVHKDDDGVYQVGPAPDEDED